MLKADLDPPCGRRPPGRILAVRACAMKPIRKMFRVGRNRAPDAGNVAVWTASRLDNARAPERHLLRATRRRIPKDLPPRSTTFGYFNRWCYSGLFARINRQLVMDDREQVGR